MSFLKCTFAADTFLYRVVTLWLHHDECIVENPGRELGCMTCTISRFRISGRLAGNSDVQSSQPKVAKFQNVVYNTSSTTYLYIQLKGSAKEDKNVSDIVYKSTR
jgi:hypothetical protein